MGVWTLQVIMLIVVVNFIIHALAMSVLCTTLVHFLKCYSWHQKLRISRFNSLLDHFEQGTPTVAEITLTGGSSEENLEEGGTMYVTLSP